MSAVLVAFSHVFRDFGVNSYIKRQKNLDTQTIRTATGILYLTSITMALILFLSSWAWAAFFKVEGVRTVVQILSIGFLFIPFGAIPGAVLSRNLEVEKIARVTIFATTVYCTASILLAVNGFSYTSMAWANLANIIATGIGFHFVKPIGLPRRPSLIGWKEIVGFGGGTVLTSSLKAVENAIPDIMLGRLATPAHVGLYSRANSTVGIINSVLTPTINALALPYLSKAFHAKDRLDAEFCKGTSYLASVIWPALAFVLFMRHEVVMFLYGDAWLGAVPAITWLCLAFAIQTSFVLVPPTLTGMGKPYISAAPIAVTLAVKVAVVWLIFDGSLQRFALAVLIGEIAAIPIYLFILRAQLGISVKKWIHVQARPAALALVVSGILWGIQHYLQTVLPVWALLLVAAIAIAISWVVGAKALKLPIWLELQPFFKRFIT